MSRYEMVCARCDQPIRFRELYHKASRAALIGNDDEQVVVRGADVLVHDYPCPTRIEVVDGRVLMNGVDIGPEEAYRTPPMPPHLLETLPECWKTAGGTAVSPGEENP